MFLSNLFRMISYLQRFYKSSYSISLIRRMSTHIDRTKDIARDCLYSPAVVEQIENISPTVKKLILKVENADLTFKPGQWVDFHIPNLSTVGGYSMCSTPSLMKQHQRLDLAVKYSEHPPAHWVHTKCTSGQQVAIQVGGTFHRNVTSENYQENILFIAAGVGINPLLSMFRHAAEQFESHQDKINHGKVMLLYTATTYDELIFKETIDGLTDNKKFFSKYFVTKESSGHNDVKNQRIGDSDLESAVNDLSDKKVVCYLCGPLDMMDSMKKSLICFGVDSDNVKYESWW